MSTIADALDDEAAELERCAARLRERAQQLRDRVVPAPSGSKYLRARDLAELLAVHPRTVRRWRSEGRLPEPIAISGVLRWDRRVVEAWLAERGESSDQPSLPRQRAG